MQTLRIDGVGDRAAFIGTAPGQHNGAAGMRDLRRYLAPNPSTKDGRRQLLQEDACPGRSRECASSI
jgi:hypothetical protein